MLLKPLTLAAGLMALPATRALLIPPEVSDADIQVANTIESVGSQVAATQVVDVECPGCPILLTCRRGKGVQLKIDRPSHLELAFSVDHQPDHDRLLVNGFELFPSSSPFSATLSAPQIVDPEEKDKGKRHHSEDEHHERPHKLTPQPQRLGFGLKVTPPKKDAEGQFELVEVELQIIEVGVAFIDGIPNVKVKLIKDGEGRLLMSQIEKGEPKNLLKGPGDSGAKCTTALCKWLAIARQRLERFKGFGHCHDALKYAPVSGDAPHRRPHHHRPHHHHPGADNWRATYQGRHWGKLFKHMASHILLPVLIGIVAGVSASLIGMAVGTVLITLWRAVFRRRRGGGCGHRRRHSGHGHHHKAPRKEAALSEEKSGLMEYQDEPPSYEEEETAKTPLV